jgi:hypothetical protein
LLFYNYRVKSAVRVTAAMFGDWKMSLNISSQEKKKKCRRLCINWHKMLPQSKSGFVNELLRQYQTSVSLKKREKELHL